MAAAHSNDASVGDRRKVLLGVTGSIAAYKAAEIARLLVVGGFEVRVVMTEAAQQFITPLTLQSVTGHRVHTSFWDEAAVSDGSDNAIGHIQLADWADLVLIAPATADCIAKLTLGAADDALLAVALATRAPIVVAPAMNVNMFEHPATQNNIATLRERGVYFVDPDEGALACGWNGQGRLAAPVEILDQVRRLLSKLDFRGKRVLVSTGPTREAIDPVRFISNRSSGKMGVAVAREAYRRGAEVVLVHGPVTVDVQRGVQKIPVTSAAEMHGVITEYVFGSSTKPDVVVMAAAVADYRPSVVAPHKLKKSGPGSVPTLPLAQTTDILRELGERRGGGQTPRLVGFAVETGDVEQLLTEVKAKLSRKGADMIVGNLAAEAFDRDLNRVWIVDAHGREDEVATTSKTRIANRILDAILKLE